MIELRRETPDTAAARDLFELYVGLVQRRLGPGFEPSETIFANVDAFRGPGSAWLMLYDGDRPIGCGGLRTLEPGVGEIKRMFVVQAARRRGHGRRLLAELERLARASGHRRVRLLTTEALDEATELYRTAGYRVASSWREGDRVDSWLEKRLP